MMMRFWKKITSVYKSASCFICLGLLATCCGCDEVEPASYGLARRAILNGSEADQPEYDSVVSISAVVGGVPISYCSGIAIAPDVVLTAAHCLTDEAGFEFDLVWERGLLRVISGVRAGDAAADAYEVDRFVIHPGYRPGNSYADVALVWLQTPMDVAVSSVPGLDEMPEALSAHPLEFVGYGLDDGGESGKRLRVAASLRESCSIFEKSACSVQISGGDLREIPPGAFLFDIEKGGPCFGDSGGPVLMDRNGEKHVVGVVSAGDEGCKNFSVVTDVSAYASWIADQLAEDSAEASACSANTRHSCKMPIWLLYVLAVGPVLWLKRGRRSLAARMK